MSKSVGALGVLMLAALAMPEPAAAQAQTPVDSLALARQYTMWLYAGEVDSLVAHYQGEREAEDVRARFRQASDLLAERAGLEIEVMEETWKLRNGQRQYWRTAKFSEMPEPLLIRWVMNPDGQHTGIGIGPASQAPPVDEEQ